MRGGLVACVQCVVVVRDAMRGPLWTGCVCAVRLQFCALLSRRFVLRMQNVRHVRLRGTVKMTRLANRTLAVKRISAVWRWKLQVVSRHPGAGSDQTVWGGAAARLGVTDRSGRLCSRLRRSGNLQRPPAEVQQAAEEGAVAAHSQEGAPQAWTCCWGFCLTRILLRFLLDKTPNNRISNLGIL